MKTRTRCSSCAHFFVHSSSPALYDGSGDALLLFPFAICAWPVCIIKFQPQNQKDSSSKFSFFCGDLLKKKKERKNVLTLSKLMLRFCVAKKRTWEKDKISSERRLNRHNNNNNKRWVVVDGKNAWTELRQQSISGQVTKCWAVVVKVKRSNGGRKISLIVSPRNITGRKWKEELAKKGGRPMQNDYKNVTLLTAQCTALSAVYNLRILTARP